MVNGRFTYAMGITNLPENSNFRAISVDRLIKAVSQIAPTIGNDDKHFIMP